MMGLPALLLAAAPLQAEIKVINMMTDPKSALFIFIFNSSSLSADRINI